MHLDWQSRYAEPLAAGPVSFTTMDDVPTQV